jgi:hypothetical protein
MFSSEGVVGVHVLFECVPLHEQGLMCGIVVLMKVGWDLESTPNIYEKLE